MMPSYENYEAVIGLEVHCQLATSSKVFSQAATRCGAGIWGFPGGFRG